MLKIENTNRCVFRGSFEKNSHFNVCLEHLITVLLVLTCRSESRCHCADKNGDRDCTADFVKTNCENYQIQLQLNLVTYCAVVVIIWDLIPPHQTHQRVCVVGHLFGLASTL
jgi:hypothetical protein